MSNVCLSLLRQLYASIPASKCKGLCAYSCGQMYMTPTEYELIPEHLRHPQQDYVECAVSMAKHERQHHLKQQVTEPACVYLKEGKCSIYEYRPLVCRVWGSNNMSINKCEHGCEETISDEQYFSLMMSWMEISVLDGSFGSIIESSEKVKEFWQNEHCKHPD